MEIQGSRILRMPEVCEITGLGKSTIYKKLSEGSFPEPLRLGPRAMRVEDTGHTRTGLRPRRRQWNPSEVR